LLLERAAKAGRLPVNSEALSLFAVAMPGKTVGVIKEMAWNPGYSPILRICTKRWTSPWATGNKTGRVVYHTINTKELKVKKTFPLWPRAPHNMHDIYSSISLLLSRFPHFACTCLFHCLEKEPIPITFEKRCNTYFIVMIFRCLKSWKSGHNRSSWVTVHISPFWCELAHAPSDITPAWRHKFFLNWRGVRGRRQCHNDLGGHEDIVAAGSASQKVVEN